MDYRLLQEIMGHNQQRCRRKMPPFNFTQKKLRFWGLKSKMNIGFSLKNTGKGVEISSETKCLVASAGLAKSVRSGSIVRDARVFNKLVEARLCLILANTMRRKIRIHFSSLPLCLLLSPGYKKVAHSFVIS